MTRQAGIYQSRLKVYLESFGCQMNVFDTAVIESALGKSGFENVSRPELADVILVNTCAVREHAEQRAIGRINDLSRHDKAVLVVCGCMAQRLGDRLRDLAPGVGIIAGPDTYRDLPAAIRSCCYDRVARTFLRRDPGVTYELVESKSDSPKKYLSITRGCDSFCSYCIVPYVRGPVRSKDIRTVLGEMRILEAAGAKEVTLLGQNVMSYRSAKDDFSSLLRNILRRTAIPRIRFLTTHPRDLDTEIFSIMSENARVCPHLHLPLQSGSDDVLRRMNRGYTGEQYVELVERARSIIPDLALSTDIIVGFPGESAGDFDATLEVVERVRFESAFTFRYSPRAGTISATWPDDVPDEVKRSRLETLNASLRRIRQGILRGLLGRREEILLDGTVQKGDDLFLKGRTPHFRNVLVAPAGLRVGESPTVVLKELRNHTFIGEAFPRR